MKKTKEDMRKIVRGPIDYLALYKKSSPTCGLKNHNKSPLLPPSPDL